MKKWIPAKKKKKKKQRQMTDSIPNKDKIILAL